ncbi:MAG: serine aminopeptidase domain-containing protein, partial [Acetanaerobacterium sp.]
MGLNAQKLSFLSSSGTDTIKATLWTDTEKPPRAVLQIAHGMCEYIDRYSQFAAFLVQHGFAVCGND